MNPDLKNLRKSINSKFCEIIDIEESKKVNVLYIDDEQNNLESFKACFRKIYNIYLAINTDGANLILDNEEIDIVICDYRMPTISGIDYLNSIKNKYVKTPIFMILTAYIDSEMLIQAINDVKIFKILNKPFDIDFIKKSITEANIK